MDEFYKVMGDFYTVVPRHVSPTKRLRDMKDSTFVHKKMLRDTLKREKDYGMTYCPTPDKAYVIEPHKGQIDYDLAERNPLKFVDQVIKEDITKHKLAKNKKLVQEQDAMSVSTKGKKKKKKKKIPLELTSKVTKRKAGRILTLISTTPKP